MSVLKSKLKSATCQVFTGPIWKSGKFRIKPSAYYNLSKRVIEANVEYNCRFCTSASLSVSGQAHEKAVTETPNPGSVPVSSNQTL